MARSATMPAATHHHMPAAISLNLFRLRQDLKAVSGFNAKVALLLTRVVGTMWAFWAFNGIALVSLPSAVHQHSLTVLINWVSSNWIQLILLPALMVGQNLAAAASDARAAKTFEDAEAANASLAVALDRLDVTTEGGLKAILDAVNALASRETLEQKVTVRDTAVQAALLEQAKRSRRPGGGPLSPSG